MEKKKCVWEIQDAIMNMNKAYNKYFPLNPDGIFGKETEEAVKEFQNDFYLPPTGEVDFKTWEKLMEEGKKALREIKKPCQIVPLKNSDLPLKENDETGLVRVLQQILNFDLSSAEDFEELPCTGIYCEKTKEAVKKWQKICRIEENGVTDKITWDLLARFYLLFN